jgi:hypothetical protein
MRWPWLPPSRGDIAAIVMGVVLVAALVIGFFIIPPTRQRPTNAGFGPDWGCVDVPYSTICFKRPPANPPVKAMPPN